MTVQDKPLPHPNDPLVFRSVEHGGNPFYPNGLTHTINEPEFIPFLTDAQKVEITLQAAKRASCGTYLSEGAGPMRFRNAVKNTSGGLAITDAITCPVCLDKLRKARGISEVA